MQKCLRQSDLQSHVITGFFFFLKLYYIMCSLKCTKENLTQAGKELTSIGNDRVRIHSFIPNGVNDEQLQSIGIDKFPEEKQLITFMLKKNPTPLLKDLQCHPKQSYICWVQKETLVVNSFYHRCLQHKDDKAFSACGWRSSEILIREYFYYDKAEIDIIQPLFKNVLIHEQRLDVSDTSFLSKLWLEMGPFFPKPI